MIKLNIYVNITFLIRSYHIYNAIILDDNNINAICHLPRCDTSQVPDDENSEDSELDNEITTTNSGHIKKAISRRSRKDRLLLSNVAQKLDRSKIFIMSKNVPYIKQVLDRVLVEREEDCKSTDHFLFRILPNGLPEKLNLTETSPSVSYYFCTPQFTCLGNDVLSKVEDILAKQRDEETKAIVHQENLVRQQKLLEKQKKNKKRKKTTSTNIQLIHEPDGVHEGMYFNDQKFIGPVLPVRLFKNNTETFKTPRSRTWITTLIKNPTHHVSPYWNRCYFQWMETRAIFPEEYSSLPYIFINDHICGIHRNEAITYAEDSTKVFLTQQTFPPLKHNGVLLLTNMSWYEESTHKESKQQIIYYHNEFDNYVNAFRDNILVDVGFQNRIYMRQMEICGRMMTCFCPCSYYMKGFRNRTHSEYFFKYPHWMCGESFQAGCCGLTEGNYTPAGLIAHLKSEIVNSRCPLHYFTLKYLERLYSHLDYFPEFTHSINEHLDDALSLKIPESDHYFFDRTNTLQRTRH